MSCCTPRNRWTAIFDLQTHSTNPLLDAATINRAIDTFLSTYPTHDSLFSVIRVQARLWDGLARAVNHNPAILLRTQDLPPIYQEKVMPLPLHTADPSGATQSNRRRPVALRNHRHECRTSTRKSTSGLPS